MKCSITILMFLATTLPALAAHGETGSPDAPRTAPAASAAEGSLAEVVEGIVGPAAVSVDEGAKTLVATVTGRAPSLKAMRARVKKLREGLAGRRMNLWTVSLRYPSANRVALSKYDDTLKRFVTRVGDGHTMLEDRSDYELAVSSKAQTRTSRFGLDGGTATCKGSVENLSEKPKRLTVWCLILEEHPVHGLRIAAKEAQELGRIRPGKRKRYRMSMDSLERAHWSSEYSFFLHIIPSDEDGLIHELDLKGDSIPYFHEESHHQGVAWLQLLDSLRRHGVELHVPITGFERIDPTPSFLVPHTLREMSRKRRNKLVRLVWRKVRAYYKKHRDGKLVSIDLHSRKSKEVIGFIEDGRFDAIEVEESEAEGGRDNHNGSAAGTIDERESDAGLDAGADTIDRILSDLDD